MASGHSNTEIGKDYSLTLMARNSKQPPILVFNPSEIRHGGNCNLNSQTGTLLATESKRGDSGIHVLQGATVRRLMPIEAERLQGFPDNHTKYGRKENGTVYEIADSHRYKQCGNAVTVKVFEEVFARIRELS
jgi:DNA (cytosine-5)-methyltransferase 1